MTLNQNTSPRGFLIYESTYNQLIKCFTPQQIGEFIKLAGDYILNGNKEVESDDPLVDTMLQMSKPTLDSAERRHRAAVENGMKGAEHGKKGGRPRKDNQPPKENPQITPIKPLEKEIEDEKEVEIEKEKDIKNNIDIDKEIDSSNTSNIYSINYLIIYLLVIYLLLIILFLVLKASLNSPRYLPTRTIQTSSLQSH